MVCWVEGSLATKPGAIRGAIWLAKTITRRLKTVKITKLKEIMEEVSSQAFSSLSLAICSEKTGIKARAMAPKIKTSKIASGRTEAAMKLSKSLMSSPKFEAKRRYLIRPKTLEMATEMAITAAAERIFACFSLKMLAPFLKKFNIN